MCFPNTEERVVRPWKKNKTRPRTFYLLQRHIQTPIFISWPGGTYTLLRLISVGHTRSLFSFLEVECCVATVPCTDAAACLCRSPRSYSTQRGRGCVRVCCVQGGWPKAGTQFICFFVTVQQLCRLISIRKGIFFFFKRNWLLVYIKLSGNSNTQQGSNCSTPAT